MSRKLENLNNNQNKTTSDLNEKNQELKSIFIDKHDWKKSNIISDTDWITITPTISASDKTTIKNQLLPQSVIFNNNFNINLPKRYLPFLQANLIIKTPSELQTVGVLSYNQGTYEGDYFEVYGNNISNLIYKGTSRPIYYLHTQNDLISGKFTEPYTKAIYRAVITYTEGGDEYKIDGTLIEILIRENVGGLTPAGNQNYDEWDSFIDPGYVSSKHYAKFNSLSNTEVTMRAIKHEHRWLEFDPPHVSPPFEYEEITDIEDVSVNKLFSSVNRELYKVKLASKYKKISGVYVLQSIGDFTFDSLTQTLISRSFTFLGYWLFYEPTTKYLFGIIDSDPVVIEGDFHKKELTNLPQDPNRDWTTILFYRNPEPHPLSTLGGVIAKGEKQLALSNLYPSDINPDKFNLNVKGVFLLQSQALEAEDIEYPVYNDTYIQDAISYVPTENHILKKVYYYRGQNLPIDYKIQIVLINPNDFFDRKTYEL